MEDFLLLEDVNLDKVDVRPDGRTILFKFLDMNEGELVSNLLCSSVYMLNYQNMFDDDDGFACYVGEVRYSCIAQSKLSEWIRDTHFKFSSIPHDGDLYLLHLEGGEVVIDVACQKLEVDGKWIETTTR